MSLTSAEFEAILADDEKSIIGDIQWSEDEDHSPCMVFRAQISNESGWPLFVNGSYNPLIPRTSFHLIHRQCGRVYGLDHGQDHRNPDGNLIGEKHKHRWSEIHRDKEAYVPPDITALPSEPALVWTQFCSEARIRHTGTLAPPPPYQSDLIL